MQNLHRVMRRCRVGLWLLVGGWTAAAWAQTAPPLAGKTVIQVAAASNLKFALADVLALYQQQTGQAVRLSLGASGALAQQIRQGLPVGLFVSADEARVDELVKAGLTQDAGQRYATGRLALLVPQNSSLPLDAGLQALVHALNKQDKLAIANPELAPYGLAAQEALAHEGVWALAQPRLVKGENIAQTTQFVVTGAAAAGITALSLVMAPEVAQRTRFKRIPSEWHAPLHQKLVLLKGANPETRQFRDFLLSPPAQAVFRRHGYDTSP